MPEEILKRLHPPKLGPCACSQVRRLSRKLSSLYDTLLSPERLTITQYSLLANIERAGQLSHAVLAEKVGMDRTTLTRNLRALTRAKWVATPPPIIPLTPLLLHTPPDTPHLHP